MLTHKQKSEAFGLQQGWEVIEQLGALEIITPSQGKGGGLTTGQLG